MPEFQVIDEIRTHAEFCKKYGLKTPEEVDAEILAAIDSGKLTVDEFRAMYGLGPIGNGKGNDIVRRVAKDVSLSDV